jgi:hypothetical protein
MEFRRLLRPLPLFLIALFVAVAVADLFQKLVEEPPPPPEVMGTAVPRFEALEPVIDFRLDREDPAVEVGPIPELGQGHWSIPGRSGVWAKGTAAELTLDLVAGGHRVLILECLPKSGKRAVRALRLKVNGVDCGEIALVRGWKRYRLMLPDGVVRAGPNRIAFGFPDRDGSKRVRRALLIRGLGLFLAGTVGVESLDTTRPVSLDLDAEKFTLRRSGTLEMPLVLEDRTDSLQMRYRFASDEGSAEVVVERSPAGNTGATLRRSLSADDQAAGRIRVPLHGRRGEFVLRIRADLATLDNRLQIWSLRLVEEGDPTRRPRAANPPPS